ncbi:hypothetical protein GW17_00010609 [Ensete ventricosum]|nr:hypothetical protein GW17_00010609 [Ensete ventricosum]
MPGVIIAILWILCTVVVLAISWSFLKAVCDGPPGNRTATSTVTTTTAAVASIAAAAPNASGIMTAGSAAAAPGDVLSVLPVFVYSTAQKKKLSCCVCLMDFKEGEKGRFLPRCFHCFHVDCIDMWLTSHSDCPVCRASIDPEAPELAV